MEGNKNNIEQKQHYAQLCTCMCHGYIQWFLTLIKEGKRVNLEVIMLYAILDVLSFSNYVL